MIFSLDTLREEAEEEQETEREKFNPGFKFIDYAPLVFMKLREIANISKDEYLVFPHPNVKSDFYRTLLSQKSFYTTYRTKNFLKAGAAAFLCSLQTKSSS